LQTETKYEIGEYMNTLRMSILLCFTFFSLFGCGDKPGAASVADAVSDAGPKPATPVVESSKDAGPKSVVEASKDAGPKSVPDVGKKTGRLYPRVLTNLDDVTVVSVR
jgi:hypothetical protein